MTRSERDQFQEKLDAAEGEADFRALARDLEQLTDDDPDKADLGEQLSMVALSYGVDLDGDGESDEE